MASRYLAALFCNGYGSATVQKICKFRVSSATGEVVKLTAISVAFVLLWVICPSELVCKSDRQKYDGLKRYLAKC